MSWLNETKEYLVDELKRTFYSARESKIEVGRNKHLSTTTPEILTQEPDSILSDVSYSYILGSQIDFILTQRNNLIKQWRSTTYLPEVDEAIQEIVNEVLVYEEDETLPIELNLEDLELQEPIKEKIMEAFEKIMNLLEFHIKGSEIFRQWYTDGILSLECIYDNAKISEGIKKITVLSPFDFYKMKDINSGEVTFFYSTRLNSEIANKAALTMMQLHAQAQKELKYKPEQVTQITSGIASIDKLFSLSNLNKAMKVINQVALIEDSILIYRITRAPEKKVFYIDTGRMAKGKAEQYIQNMMLKHRQKMVYNVDTGKLENRKKTISLMEDYWLPRSADGRGTQIETLQGSGQELRDIADLEFFYDKMYRALNVPTTRRKSESRAPNFNSSAIDVENEEVKFFKFTILLRKKFNELFRDLLKKELIATKVIKLEDWQKWKHKVKFDYKNNNEYAEMKKLQVFESRMNIAQTAMQLQELGLFSKSWMRREILNQNEEDFKKIEEEMKKELAAMPKEDVGAGGGGFRR